MTQPQMLQAPTGVVTLFVVPQFPFFVSELAKAINLNLLLFFYF
jgi:hypothetical protein